MALKGPLAEVGSWPGLPVGFFPPNPPPLTLVNRDLFARAASAAAAILAASLSLSTFSAASRTSFDLLPMFFG
jgi:hypothetical protein